MHKFEKPPSHIVVLGGGTAGWMAANLLIDQLAKWRINITLIESSNIPTVGVGEGSTPYLKEFLSDPRVVEVPKPIWWCILNLIILNIRPKRSAEAYASVWTDEGSPLLIHTRDQARLLQERLSQELGEHCIVDFAMRYGQPDIAGTVQGMIEKGVTRLLILPLYPQYSGATTGSTFDALAADFTRRRWLPETRFVSQYHDHDAYIEAIANSIRHYREQHGSADKLLFSYHGEPRRYLDQGDPYHCQCQKTTRLLRERLGWDKSEIMTTFQSKFGPEEWLKPYTVKEVARLAEEDGKKKIAVIAPAFSADCIETLEEINEEIKESFEEAGGEHFTYIPCLNDDDAHIAALSAVIEENLNGWLD